MKVKLLFSFIFLFFSISSIADSVQLTNKEKYNSALAYYKNKNFQKSYSLLSQIYITELSNIKLNFILGRSAFEIGNYNMALAAFDRVSMLEPNNIRNMLEKGRTYYKLEMNHESKVIFKKVLANPNLPKNVRVNIEIYLSKISKGEQVSFTYVNFDLDFLYDSNLNYGSLDSEYYVNIGKLPSESEKSDTGYQMYLNLTNIYNLDKNGKFAIKNKIDFYFKNYLTYDEYNILYLSYHPSILYKTKDSTSGLAFGIDSLSLNNEEYLRTLSVSPSLEYRYTKNLRSIHYLKFQRKYYQHEIQKELNSNHYEFFAALQNIISTHSYFQIDATAIKEKKISGDRIDVDYNDYKVSTMYFNQLTPIFSTNIFLQYRNRYYQDSSQLFFDTKRVDKEGVGSITLNAAVLKMFLINMKIKYNRVESNHERYSYQKHTLSLGVHKTF